MSSAIEPKMAALVKLKVRANLLVALFSDANREIKRFELETQRLKEEVGSLHREIKYCDTEQALASAELQRRKDEINRLAPLQLETQRLMEEVGMLQADIERRDNELELVSAELQHRKDEIDHLRIQQMCRIPRSP